MMMMMMIIFFFVFQVVLTIENGEIVVKEDEVPLFVHHASNISKFCLEPGNMRTFMYLVRDKFEPVLNVYLFQSDCCEDVSALKFIYLFRNQ